jgi:serine O-acetyltransferase
MSQEELAQKIESLTNTLQISSFFKLKAWIDELFLILFFAEYKNSKLRSWSEISLALESSQIDFSLSLHEALPLNLSSTKEISCELYQNLPNIYECSISDAKAFLAHDPAAKSLNEVISSYLGFKAIVYYRIIHCLANLEVKLLPRALAEFVHEKTGIDIHPLAKIGKEFVIDHGTGVVIGETVEIGDRVKIYQGVTLGALSVNKKHFAKKRHPTIEDDVVIYANATILGGETVIGSGSIIGGNSWILQSVPPNSKILNAKKSVNSF